MLCATLLLSRLAPGSSNVGSPAQVHMRDVIDLSSKEACRQTFEFFHRVSHIEAKRAMLVRPAGTASAVHIFDNASCLTLTRFGAELVSDLLLAVSSHSFRRKTETILKHLLHRYRCRFR